MRSTYAAMTDEELFQKIGSVLGSGALAATVWGVVKLGRGIWNLSAREEKLNNEIDNVTLRMNELAELHERHFARLNERLDEHSDAIAYLRGKLE